MKHVPNIVGGLLGLAFIAFSLMYFIKFRGYVPPLPEDSPVMHFNKAFGPTGYMDFVKVCELLGGIMCAIPLTRNIGLLFLGPVILNITAFHGLVARDSIVFPAILCAISAYLLWSARAKFAGLLNR